MPKSIGKILIVAGGIFGGLTFLSNGARAGDIEYIVEKSKLPLGCSPMKLNDEEKAHFSDLIPTNLSEGETTRKVELFYETGYMKKEASGISETTNFIYECKKEGEESRLIYFMRVGFPTSDIAAVMTRYSVQDKIEGRLTWSVSNRGKDLVVSCEALRKGFTDDDTFNLPTLRQKYLPQFLQTLGKEGYKHFNINFGFLDKDA